MKAIQIILCFLLLLVTMKISSAQPGTLDPTFGTGGIVDLHPNFTTDQTKDIALTTDGKILLLSTNSNGENYLLKLSADGSLDTTWNQGKLLLPVYSAATALEIDNLNRILIYEKQGDDYDNTMYVHRFQQNGSIDLTFGNDGSVKTKILNANRAMIIQPDNKILIGGQNNYDGCARVQRFKEDGTTDSSFNGNGRYTFNDLLGSYIFSFAFQTDGKILATGIADSAMFIARFNDNGHPDSTFDFDGYAKFYASGVAAGQDVTELPDGKILIAGHKETFTESSMLCWRLFADGTLDNSFGNNGVASLYTGSENNFAWFVFGNADSTAIIGGSVFDGVNYQPVIYHVLYDGFVDNNFGVNGVAGKTFDCGNSIQVNSLRLANGNILASGTAFQNGNNAVGVSQFLADGSADLLFGSSGFASFRTIDSSYSFSTVEDFIVLADGKILCTTNVLYTMVFFRLNTDGSLDSSYGENGYYVPNQRAETAGWEVGATSTFIARDSSSIYVAQDCYHHSLGDEDRLIVWPGNDVFIHKLNSNGMPDTSFGSGSILKMNSNIDYNQMIICSDLKCVPGGKVLFAADQHDPYGTYIKQLKSDGSIDSTFADNGKRVFDFANYDHDLLIAPRHDDKIVCVWDYYQYNSSTSYISISRILPDGSLDSTFGLNSNISIEVDYISDVDQLLLQSDNKILILFTYGNNQILHAIIQLNEDGTIDSTFGANGYLNPDWCYADYGKIGIQLQADGKILFSNGSCYSTVSVIRYLSHGSMDMSFGTDGIATTPIISIGQFTPHVTRVQPDGKILVATELDHDFIMLRLLNDIGLIANEPVTSSMFHVYPNPVSDQLIIINHFSADEQTTISITDITGRRRQIEDGKFSGDNFTLPVQDLSPGIYMITVQTENNSVTAKFVKQ